MEGFKNTFEKLYQTRLEYNKFLLEYKNLEDKKKTIFAKSYIEIKQNSKEKMSAKDIENYLYISDTYINYINDVNKAEKKQKINMQILKDYKIYLNIKKC
jgi:hypothetical protein